MRASPDVIDNFKASGTGWQARMDAVVKEYVHNHTTGDAKGTNIKIQKKGAEVIGNSKVSARF